MNNKLYILKKRVDMEAAQQAAQHEFNAFNKEFPELNIKVQHVQFWELYRSEGQVAYLMRITIEAETDARILMLIRRWAQEHIICDVPVTWDALNPILNQAD